MDEVLCSYCKDLSIDRLVQLMQEDLRQSSRLPPPPPSLCYQHHASFLDLENAANNGCPLCQLIVDCFKWTAYQDGHIPRWPRDHKPSAELAGSMYAVAKGLEVSDVRICLNNRHITSEWNMSRSVDQMNVRVGPFYELPLVITSPRANRQRVGDYPVGRFETDLDLGSEANYNTMRSWLEECQQKHPHCLDREHGPPELPTRVMDVGVTPVGIEPHPASVRILCSRGMRANYIALSHCWGGTIKMVLKESRLAEFQNAIFTSSLPRNFRDAIAITRNLGIRYLWIDSLCIIQDSRSDWEKESKKMGHVYRNAFLTISATAAEGSEGGILGPWPTIDFPKPATVRVFPSGDENNAVVRLHLDHCENFPSWGHETAQSPLNSRGWVLQEMVLSPRNLYFGSKMIYWRCPDVLKGSDGARLLRVRPYPIEEYRHISAIIHPNTQHEPLGHDPRPLLNNYYEVVEAYTSRKLSVASDKLPAIAGIASYLLPKLGPYLAGLWAHDIHCGLLWSATNVSLSEKFIAPSWSWASRDGRVSIGNGSPSSQYNLDEWQLQILEHYISLRNPDIPFGEVTGGQLIVQGWTMPLVWGKDAVIPSFNSSQLRFDARKEVMAMILSKDSNLGTCFLYRIRDSNNSVEKSTRQFAASEEGKLEGQVYVALMVVATRGLGAWRSRDTSEGLISVVGIDGLVLCPRGEKYIRVGRFNCSLDEDSLGNWPQMWVKQRLILI
ncbi:heterokaryon incompatibility protein-domain-containing protein [Ilyonectria sp. MPI-CAGE-AT-0026]|nr:heterokaryon incompatibility protein-domain-containing protein [Ilyonectria sp. MPI-CAGE-AT-0026]